MKLQLFTQFTAALAMSMALNTSAQPNVKLEHDSSWELARRECTIRVLHLANLGSEDTGPLYLSVYARPGTGWDGVGSPGTLVARAPIAAIAPNSSADNLVETTKGRALPPGEKFTALVVEMKSGRQYVPLDYVIYTSTYAFPRGQSGGVGSDDFSIGVGDITLIGSVSLTGAKRRAEYFIERIQNRRDAAASGTLRLAIYATAEPYDGSTVPTVVATRVLGHLAQGDFYERLQGKLNLKRPGRGTFYLTLALEEDQGAGFQTAAYVTSPEPRQF